MRFFSINLNENNLEYQHFYRPQLPPARRWSEVVFTIPIFSETWYGTVNIYTGEFILDRAKKADTKYTEVTSMFETFLSGKVFSLIKLSSILYLISK
ncbi:hypothetical protein TPSD3_13835 [Thioflexithrix psekupsensis]|uniref:Uncharacterized protein n=1 Tax=Thioflexithrix psekupsensis TaxID=1570016 RepID=A0A251X522_9GAMM|nr:hypothetical protein TPSD3_13835 [Thioflexithrix psekupsensis]